MKQVRNKKTGGVFDWSEALAKRDDMETLEDGVVVKKLETIEVLPVAEVPVIEVQPVEEPSVEVPVVPARRGRPKKEKV